MFLENILILYNIEKKGMGKRFYWIQYCKNLNKYNVFRVETTYYENSQALFLYDKVMQMKENYTIEDTDTFL